MPEFGRAANQDHLKASLGRDGYAGVGHLTVSCEINMALTIRQASAVELRVTFLTVVLQ